MTACRYAAFAELKGDLLRTHTDADADRGKNGEEGEGRQPELI